MKIYFLENKKIKEGNNSNFYHKIIKMRKIFFFLILDCLSLALVELMLNKLTHFTHV